MQEDESKGKMYKKITTLDICIMMAMTIMLASTGTDSYNLKCPDRSQRKIRAKFVCNSTEENYSCMLDLQKRTFTESCSFTSDFVRPGQKYVISGRRKNTNCSDDQYQPFKFFSSELSICAYAKSSCSEEGQIIFSEGTTKEDRSCGCDYSKGYTYLSTPKHQCFCTPKEEDCSCYIATCPKGASPLSDNQCKVDFPSPEICKPNVQMRQRHTIDISADKKDFEKSSMRREARNFTTLKVTLLIAVIILAVFIQIVIAGKDTCQRKTSDELSNSICYSDIDILPHEDHTVICRKQYESLEEIIQMEEFKNILKDKLSAAYPNGEFIHIINSAKRYLVVDNYGIFITGGTRAGKLEMLNQIVGEKIFPTNNSTDFATICRLRHCTEMSINTYTKRKGLLEKQPIENIKQMKSAMKRLTSNNKAKCDKEDNAFYIDVYFPVQILKGNVLIVDTSGNGDSKELADSLLTVLPQEISFIFVLNAKNDRINHEDRVSQFLKTILRNIKNMPGFESWDLFFLTNQWDTIRQHRDTEMFENNTKRECLKLNSILSKIAQESSTRRYALLTGDDDKSFLRRWKQSVSNVLYTTDFKKIGSSLNGTLKRNRIERDEFYSSFLHNFTKEVNRLTAVHIKTLQKEIEDTKQSIGRNLDKIESDDKMKVLQNHKKNVVNELSLVLLEYLNSKAAQKEVFNPEGERSITKVKLEDQNDALCSRVNLVIEKWFNNIAVEKKIKEANEKLQLTCNVISPGIEIRLEPLNPQLRKANYNNSTSLTVFKGHNLIQVIVLNYTASLSDTIKNLIFGKKFRLKMAEKRLTNMIDVFSKTDTKNIIEDCFGKEYDNAIERIFKQIPKEINESMQTSDEILKGQRCLDMKEREFKQLQLIVGLFDDLHKLKLENIRSNQTHLD